MSDPTHWPYEICEIIGLEPEPMMLGQKRKFQGVTYECVSHTSFGEPIYRRLDTGERTTKPAPRSQVSYEVGEVVRIIGMMPGLVLEGEVTSIKPLGATVTTRHPVWHGATVGYNNIRKRKR